MADPLTFDQMPFRLKVLTRLTEALQQIQRDTPGAHASYSYSLAPDETWPDGKVLRGRGTYGNNDPLPLVSILEDPKQLEQDAPPDGADVLKGPWDLLIQGFIMDDPVHPTDPAYVLLADVKSALQSVKADPRNILGFGSKRPTVMSLSIGSGVVRPADDISATTYFWIPIRLELVEDPDAFT